ncbi:estradiol 17-beta-dehydrogenase 8 [Apis mellifera caucasica]|uniref:(3R)-3-hydroxyacyl-CoA dehydrogenase n=1 Tax=Apis mellifera TaxID=7460 RepID=A0A7M7GJY4_APIME|nr:estradiol 17-beta-dehydrogenase 8 [Apis mellifera]KAG6801960.1 estradiol 17-beta-dehydrogenase 8 [Apis mellifera caucasica]KAG9433362.1 estradiol 17-beta-dehydrogenase 8 [Apis mellifera carnica]|eukprot:XP_006558481.1 estradiol 17-beta-dehydrogenase 8 [Apis mellifera]
MVAGKIAFVTGAGSGIGRKVCHILAKQGASVIATDINLKNAEETIRSLNDSRHLALNVEVLNEQSIKEAFKNVINKYSTPPTIIVNSAGITSDQFILKLTNEDFDKVLNVNLKGTFFIIQTAVKEMINANVNKGGSIVNISSIIGKIGNMGQANYAASKAGVIALTKTASLEFGQFGIRVNTVLPGFIETPMTKTIPENIKQLFIKRIPLHRMGKPEEVAEVISFLASSKSSYINGASIDVTGGLY